MLCRLRGPFVVVRVSPTPRQAERWRSRVLVRDRTQNMGDAVEARAALVIRLHGPPASLLDVRMTEHRVLRPGVLDPFGHGFEVHRAQLPSARRVARPLLEASLLFLVTDRKPVFQQDYAGAHQHAFELGTGAHELAVLVVAAEAHHMLHARAVVPTAVE